MEEGERVGGIVKKACSVFHRVTVPQHRPASLVCQRLRGTTVNSPQSTDHSRTAETESSINQQVNGNILDATHIGC